MPSLFSEIRRVRERRRVNGGRVAQWSVGSRRGYKERRHLWLHLVPLIESSAAWNCLWRKWDFPLQKKIHLPAFPLPSHSSRFRTVLSSFFSSPLHRCLTFPPTSSSDCTDLATASRRDIMKIAFLESRRLSCLACSPTLRTAASALIIHRETQIVAVTRACVHFQLGRNHVDGLRCGGGGGWRWGRHFALLPYVAYSENGIVPSRPPCATHAHCWLSLRRVSHGKKKML